MNRLRIDEESPSVAMVKSRIPIHLQVDKQSPIPIRRQLTEQLKHLIEAGGIPSDQPLPSMIAERRQRACDLLAGAPTTRGLRKAVHLLRGSIRSVSAARRRGVSAACAGALRQDLRDARDRAARALTTLE